MTRPLLRFLGLVTLLGLFSGGCGSGSDHTLPTEPSSLDTLDPPIRAQYSELRSNLEEILAQRDGTATEQAEAFGALGRWYHAQRLFGGAATAYESAADLAPDEPAWPYYLAHIKQLHNERESARLLFQRVLELEPESVPALVWLAEIELDDGRTEVAQHHFSRVLELRPECVRAMAGVAKTRSIEGDHDAAVVLYQRALSLQPDATPVRYALAVEYQRAGDRERAEAEMAKIPLDNRDQRPASLDDPLMQDIEMLQRGYSLEQMLGRKALNEGRPAVAAQHFRRAVEQRPDATTARINLVLALKRTGQLDAARREAMIAVELDPHSADARFALAEILLAVGQYGEATNQLEAAVEADPDHKTARFNLAQLFRGTGQFEQALPHYVRVRELDHQMVRATHGQAVTLVWLGRPGDALASVQQALEWSPEHPELLLLQSRLLATMPDGSMRDGREALDLALRVFSTESSVSAAETVAMAYAEIGRFDSAVAWQRAALASVVNRPRGRIVDLVRYRLDFYDRGSPCSEPWLRGESFCPFPTERPAES